MLWIAMHLALIRAIDAGPTKGLTLIGNRHGRPIKKAALSNLIKRAAADARLPPKCVARRGSSFGPALRAVLGSKMVPHHGRGE